MALVMKKMIKELFSVGNEKQISDIEDNILSLEKARERLQKFQTEREERGGPTCLNN